MNTGSIQLKNTAALPSPMLPGPRASHVPHTTNFKDEMLYNKDKHPSSVKALNNHHRPINTVDKKIKSLKL